MSYENQWGKNTYFSFKLIYPANQFLFGSPLLVILFMYYFINLSLFLHECSKGQDVTFWKAIILFWKLLQKKLWKLHYSQEQKR